MFTILVIFEAFRNKFSNVFLSIFGFFCAVILDVGLFSWLAEQ
jgi:hypothetical protein